MPVKSQGCPPWPCGECPPGSWAFSLLKTPVAEGLRAALNAGVGVVSKQTKVLLPGSPHLARSLKQRQSLTSRPARAPCGPGAEGSDFGPSPKQPLGSSQLPSRLLEPRSPPKVPSPSSTWQRARPFPSTRSGHRVSLLGCAGLWALTRMPGVTKGKHTEWNVTSAGRTGLRGPGPTAKSMGARGPHVASVLSASQRG